MMYTLVSEAYRDKFVIQVNKLLAKGWTLHGSLMIKDNFYLQALVGEE